VFAYQVLLFVGFLELAFMKSIDGTGNEFVGDFRNGFIDFGWDSFDAETKLQKRAVELNQGRAAQMGLLGLMVHDQLGNVGSLLPPGA
jgi:Chlorophyll A-B binding protein